MSKIKITSFKRVSGQSNSPHVQLSLLEKDPIFLNVLLFTEEENEKTR
jgi:hypothetical protein